MGSTPLEVVAVQGARKLSPAAIARDAGLLAGMPLARIDPTALRETVSAEPWIQSSRTLRLPSGTVVIGIVERDPIARWHVDETSAIALVDGDGERFSDEHADDEALPLVRGGGRETRALPEEAIALLSELRRHARLAADPRSVTLHLPQPSPAPEGADDEAEAGYVLQLGETGPRAVLGRRLLSQRIARLAALLESEESALEGARWIDLRYADRAVLRTEPASG